MVRHRHHLRRNVFHPEEQKVNRVIFPNQAMKNDSPDMKDAAKDNRESPATVLGLDNQPLASVTARLWPKLCCGGFWLPTQEDADRILKSAAMLRTGDGLHMRLLRLHQCQGLHSPTTGQIHLEFDFETV